MHVTFPHLPAWQGVQFYLGGQSLDTQESINGTPVVVPTMRGRWMATVSMVLHDEASTVQWQAFLAQMQGRIGTTDVPVLSRYPARDLSGREIPFLLPESGNLPFPAMPVRAALLADASLRDSRINLEFFDARGIEGGNFFSIGPRLHRVRYVVDISGSSRILEIEPPLRQAFAQGSAVEIGRPAGRMRFVTETEGLYDQSLALLPTVTCNFIEAN